MNDSPHFFRGCIGAFVLCGVIYWAASQPNNSRVKSSRSDPDIVYVKPDDTPVVVSPDLSPRYAEWAFLAAVAFIGYRIFSSDR